MKGLFQLFRLSGAVFFFFITLTSVLAQNGGISGKVTDIESGEELMEVSVFALKLGTGAFTDWEGNFMFENVTAGSYELFFNFPGYRADTITVEVAPGEVTELIHQMQLVKKNKVIDLGDDFAITATVEKNTDKVVVETIRNDDKIATGTSQEQMSKGQDTDAAKVMQRIPGVTIIDGKFVMIRGLSQRYNSVLINNVISPSTEPDSRAFSFDLIPTTLIERILVYKSGAADLPGDFAGSVIKIYTKNTVNENFNALGIRFGYRTGTSFQQLNQSSRNTGDYFAWGASGRKLPSDFPEDLRQLANPVSRVEPSKKLDNDWQINERNALPDFRLSYVIGRKFGIGSVSSSNITAINYSYSSLHYRTEFYRYENYANDNTSLRKFFYRDDVSNNTIRLGLMHNYSFVFNVNHKLELMNTYNRLGGNEVIIREGQRDDQGFEDRNYSLRNLNRGIYLGQLIGTHKFTKKNLEYTWVLGFANTSRNEPDWRRARTQRPLGSDQLFTVVIPPSATTFDAARFYSKLNENTYTVNGEFVYDLKEESDTTNNNKKLSFGYYLEKKDRRFDARWMAYVKGNTNFHQPLLNLPLQEMFSPENIFVTPNNGIDSSGFVLDEGTNPTDKYYASNFLAAGYVQYSSTLFKDLKFSTGVRYEFFTQKLRLTENGRDTVDYTVGRFLPFLNTTYTLSKDMQLRFAYSKSINRPEMRELAPFSFYSFQLNSDIVGNPELRIADIHNVDLRWELYPGEAELISFGVFYKYFNAPIENYVIQGQENPIFTFGNANYATSMGLEMEIRKSLKSWLDMPVIKHISLVLNASLIQSKVDLGDRTTGQVQERPLQGQSPYVVNMGLYHYDKENKWEGSILYNVFGPRIFSVGDDQIRTIYELPRHSLDITIAKTLSKDLQIKLGIVNLLNQQFLLKEDGDLDGDVHDEMIDKPILKYRTGQYFTLGLGYKF